MARDNQGWPGMARDNPDKCQNFKQIVHVAFRGQPVRMALIWQFSTSLPLLAHHRPRGEFDPEAPRASRTPRAALTFSARSRSRHRDVRASSLVIYSQNLK